MNTCPLLGHITIPNPGNARCPTSPTHLVWWSVCLQPDSGFGLCSLSCPCDLPAPAPMRMFCVNCATRNCRSSLYIGRGFALATSRCLLSLLPSSTHRARLVHKSVGTTPLPLLPSLLSFTNFRFTLPAQSLDSFLPINTKSSSSQRIGDLSIRPNW